MISRSHPYNTSQNCSHCDRKLQKSRSTRTHICLHCGFVEDRDITQRNRVSTKNGKFERERSTQKPGF
nr:transposase [Planktothrix sp. FACHB-1355]